MNSRDLPNNRTKELVDLIANQNAEIRVERLGAKALDVIQLLLWANTLGAFGGLWKVLDLWRTRHASAKVRLSFQTASGPIDVEYSNLTKSEVDRLLKERGVDLSKPIKLVVQ